MIDISQPPASRRISGDGWLVLGLLGALLGLTLFFVHVPANVWARNTAEFHSPFGAFLPITLSSVVIGLFVMMLVLWLLPNPWRAALATLVSAIGLVSWAYAFVLASNLAVLDGLDRPAAFDTALGVWELPLVGLVCALVAAGAARIHRAVITGLLTLNVGLAATTAATVWKARHSRMRAPVVEAQRNLTVFRFSPRENVLVVVLDSLQSDLADAIFRRDPELKSAFDGFHFYRDTLGVAPTTFLSLPAIHAGDTYRGRGPLAGHFEQSIRLQSFMSRFADAGYETALVNPADGVCPDGIKTCVTSSQLLRTTAAQLTRETVRLLDLSLFRMAPVWLKRHVYDGGQWTLAQWLFLSEDFGRIIEHNTLLDEIATRMTVSEGAPTLKFVHSLATHTPFVLNTDCRTFAESTSESNIVPQVHCALTTVARLLQSLKSSDVYDRTEILVLADHGMGRPTRYAGRVSRRERQWASRVGSANPVFLLKPRGDRGPLKNERAAVYLPDVGATLCRSSGACTVPLGVPVGEAPPNRPRRYLEYEWRHEFWALEEIPHVQVFEVRGLPWKQSSWRMIGESDPGEVAIGR